MAIYFYELHEGDGDLLGDAILISERAHSGEAFEQLVRTARAAVLDTFEEESLVEAVARELERSHGFIYVGDEKIRGAMSVGLEDEDTFSIETAGVYRSLVVELDAT